MTGSLLLLAIACCHAVLCYCSSGSPTPLPRSIRPRRLDDESPACKAPIMAVSPVIPGVSTRTASSMIVSSALSYARTALSYAPLVPKPRSVLYGECPPILSISISLPRFADKNFVPSHVRSSSVATQQYPSSPESRASTVCVDLDAFGSECSRSSDCPVSVSPVAVDRESVSSVDFGDDVQSDTEPTLFAGG